MFTIYEGIIIDDNYSLLDTQYKQISLKWNSDSIKKVIIEEPIAPAPERLYLFKDCTKLELIEYIKNLHTENAKSLYCMFQNCSLLKEIDVSHFDTSNVTSMIQIFTNCKSLKKIIFGRNFIINSGTNCSYALTGVTPSNIKVIAYKNNVEMIKTKFSFNNTNFEKILD